MINKRKIGFGLIFIGLVLGLSNMNITGAVIGTSGVAGWLAFLMFFSFVSGGMLVGMSWRSEEGDLERSLPERVPEGIFRADIGRHLFDGKSFGIFKDKKGKYLPVTIDAFEKERIDERTGKPITEHTDIGENGETIYHVHVSVYDPEKVVKHENGKYQIGRVGYKLDTKTLKNRSKTENGNSFYEGSIPEGLRKLLYPIKDSIDQRARQVFANSVEENKKENWYSVSKQHIAKTFSDKEKAENLSRKLQDITKRHYKK